MYSIGINRKSPISIELAQCSKDFFSPCRYLKCGLICREVTQSRDGCKMNKQSDSLNIRKGQFLWMEEAEQESYLRNLKARISDGYYYSDLILSRVADELANVMADVVDE